MHNSSILISSTLVLQAIFKILFFELWDAIGGNEEFWRGEYVLKYFHLFILSIKLQNRAYHFFKIILENFLFVQKETPPLPQKISGGGEGGSTEFRSIYTKRLKNFMIRGYYDKFCKYKLFIGFFTPWSKRKGRGRKRRTKQILEERGCKWEFTICIGNLIGLMIFLRF